MNEHPSAIRKGDPVTPALLSARLRASGGLPDGHVETIEESANPAFTSSVVHLVVGYSPDTPRDAPPRLLLKRMDRGWGEREVAFYRAVSAHPSAARILPIPRCYDAVFDPADGASHVLLEDVGATHAEAVSRADLLRGRGVPRAPVLDAIMTALARFHAAWWEDERIGKEEPFDIRSWFGNDEQLAAHLSRRARELDALRHEPDGVPDEWIAIYERALARLGPLWERVLRDRIASRRALTVTHGDCYPTQWLVPRAADPATALVVDFDSVSGGLATFDLVYLLASFWSSELRADLGDRCLRTYHDALVASGVTGYGWDDLLDDHRLMLAFYVFDPVADKSNGSPRSYWYPKMASLIEAYTGWGPDAPGDADGP